MSGAEARALRDANLREARREAVASAIEEVALRLFAERGYRSVTVEQIADAAGVSRRTFFRYFAEKSEVLLLDSRRRQERICAEMERRPADESTVAALCAALINASTYGPDELELAQVRARLMEEDPTTFEHIVSESETMWERLCERTAARLDIDRATDIRADLLVRMVRAAASATRHQWLAGGCREDPVAMMKTALEYIDGRLVAETAELDEAARRRRSSSSRRSRARLAPGGARRRNG